MLRLTIHPQQERVLLSVQTRDRNGHVVAATNPADSEAWGGSPELGYASQDSDLGRFPLVDIDRLGAFDSILIENDILDNPALAPFYDYTMQLSNQDQPGAVTPFVQESDDLTKSMAMYLGSEFAFDSIYFRLSAAAAIASATMDVEYWNGVAWTAVPNRVDGPSLGLLDDQSDEVVWDMPTDWFPARIQHTQTTIEGSRAVHPRLLFWVRVRFTSIVGGYSQPGITGVWQGEKEALDDLSLWVNAANPNKKVLVLADMQANPNTHLSQVPVVSRKAPATLAEGVVDFGVGDYTLVIPTDVPGVVTADPATLASPKTQVFDRNGTRVDFPIPSSGIVLRPGRYRARVIAEIPNVDFRLLAEQTGHTVPPPGPSPEFGGSGGSPSDPEALFDPSWQPMITAAVADFDVRTRNAQAMVDVQRTLTGVDVYALWLEIEGKLVPLRNQPTYEMDYARLIVADAVSGAVLIDTMNPALSNLGAELNPLPGVGGVDQDFFRYTETNSGRLMQNGGQYHVSAVIVRNGESFIKRVVFNFLSA
jgi:hypothetical protein